MALQLVDVDHRYGRHPSLHSVSLTLREGDCYGFIGHNGAGKTTTLRVALGLSRPVAGRVLIDGFDAAAHPREALARTGGMIESPAFYPWASARANLIELVLLQGLSRRDARRESERRLDEVGLAVHAKGRVGTYSQGMRQRLGLAQALLGGPRYVLLDEPTNGLDPEGIADFRALLRRLTKDLGMTVLLSSHHLREVADLCNRIGVLRSGRLLLEEDTERLLASTQRRCELATDADRETRAVLDRLGLTHSKTEEGTRIVDLATLRPSELVRTLAAEGIGVEQLTPRPTTLEEVYLRLAKPTNSAEAENEPPSRGSEFVTPTTRPEPRLAPSHPVLRMLRFEVQRGVRRGPIWIMVAVPALLAWRRIDELADKHATDLEQVAAGKLYSTSTVTAFDAVGLGLMAGLPIVVLAVAALASQSIAGDYSLGTLRNILLRPLRRSQVAFGKALAIATAACVTLVVLSATTIAAATWHFDFVDRVEVKNKAEPELWIEAADVWPYFPEALYAPLLPLLAYAGIGFLAGTIANRGFWALVLALSSVLILDFGRVFARAGGWEHFLPSPYLPSPLFDDKTSYLAFYLDTAIGSAEAYFEYAGSAWIVPCIWLTLTFCLAGLLLSRKHVP